MHYTSRPGFLQLSPAATPNGGGTLAFPDGQTDEWLKEMFIGELVKQGAARLLITKLVLHFPGVKQT